MRPLGLLVSDAIFDGYTSSTAIAVPLPTLGKA